MISRKNFLRKQGLYLVTDTKNRSEKHILNVIKKTVCAGIDIVQFRSKELPDKDFLKTAFKIKKLLRNKKVLFIIDDRIDIAKLVDSDGVHLGHTDICPDDARKILGKSKIIGYSTHSEKDIKEALKKDIDYISVGPIYSTPTKPDYKNVGLSLIKKANKILKNRIPFVVIGGINKKNIKEVIDAGAKRIAVVREVLDAKEPYETTKNLLKQIGKL